MRLSFAEKQAEKAEVDRDRKLRERPKRSTTDGMAPNGSILGKIEDPALAKSLERMRAGLNKRQSGDADK